MASHPPDSGAPASIRKFRRMNSSPSILYKFVVGITVEPAFPGLRRCDHRMLARVRVFGGMLVRRVIATARRATLLTYAQMDPRSAHFRALIALTALCMLDCRDRLDMRASSISHDCPLLLGQHLMDEGNRDRALAHCRRDACGIAAPDVADREHSGQTRFEKMGRRGECPACGSQIVL